MRALFGFTEQPNFPARYNIAPTQPVPIVRVEGGERHFVLVRWGFVPDWAKEVGVKPLINARAETVTQKPTFRNAIRRRRCLLPADAFYEWARAKTPKQPYMVRRRDGQPFAMAGIWEHWQSPEGSELESCAIITTAANATLSPIHHRMPVILDESDWSRWLEPDERLSKDALPLMRPAPDGLLEAVPVSARVNAVANDDADLQTPVEPAEAEAPPPPRQGSLF